MELINILKTLISIETHDNLNNNSKCVDFICTILEKNSIIYKRVPNQNNNKENIIAGINITKLEDINTGIVLSGHIDTVYANKTKWQTPPFSATIIDDKIYGRGTVDMKQFIAILLSLIPELKKIDIPILFAFSCDEETDLFGIKKILEFFKQHNIKPEYALIGEPTHLSLGIANRGYFGFTTKITGVSSHSGIPQKGCNAIYIASKIISKIEQLNQTHQISNTSLNVGKISGGTERNSVADSTFFDWDVRFFDNENKELILNELKKYISNLLKSYPKAQIKTMEKEYILCFEYTPSNNLIKKAKTVLIAKECSFLYSTEAGFFSKEGINTLIFGVGDENLAHSSNEFIKIKDLQIYKDMLLKLLTKLPHQKG